MYTFRDMARDNEMSALELHIKVNEQNLSTISEKCTNIGTLRPPFDLSWPKIPLRRLNHNADDIIEPPCVITLIETPRKNRSVVRASTCQHTRTKLNQKYDIPTQIPKRLPGSIDPRFKRQISTRQKAEKPNESCDTMKNGKQMAEINNMYALQESKKSENRSQGTIENMDNCIRYSADKLLESFTNKKEETVDCPIKDERFVSEADRRKTVISQYVINERCDLEDRFPQVQKQEIGKPFVMIDEKKIHAFPINIKAASTAQPLQFYSVQIPVVAYHNVPVQIPMQMQDDIKIEYQSNSAKNPKFPTGNGYDATSTLTNSTCGFKEYKNDKCSLGNIPEHKMKNDNILGKKNLSHCETSDWIRDKENVNSNVSLNQDTLLDKNYRKNTTDNAKDGGVSTSNLPSVEKLKTVVKQVGCNTDKNKASSETEITKISLRPNRTETEHKLMYREKISRLDELSNVMNNRTLKRASTNLSRKAKSFFRKKSRLAITDSDCTLIMPGSRHVKGKQYERTHSKVSQLLRKKNGISGTDSNIVRIKFNNAKQGRMNSCSLTNLQAKGDPFEEPSSIPLETQELLNQSYWEYYWRLRRKIASADKPDNAGERDKSRPGKESRERLPESQTLQQCSVLSCMINTALRDSTAVDGRSSSNPIVSMFNAREDVRHETSEAKKVKRRKTKQMSKRLLGLRTIALLGTMIYFAIIFLPVMYDYFFDEEYENDYENANYIGLALQYVISSFGEAFDGIVDVLNMVLLRPVRIDRILYKLPR